MLIRRMNGTLTHNIKTSHMICYMGKSKKEIKKMNRAMTVYFVAGVLFFPALCLVIYLLH